jgi:transposase
MTIPGVGPIAALSFKSAVDDPTRFKRSRTVGAYFGLTPRRYQSGKHDNPGRISKSGDRDVRAVLYAAANALLMRTMKSCQKYNTFRPHYALKGKTPMEYHRINQADVA